MIPKKCSHIPKTPMSGLYLLRLRRKTAAGLTAKAKTTETEKMLE